MVPVPYEVPIQEGRTGTATGTGTGTGAGARLLQL